MLLAFMLSLKQNKCPRNFKPVLPNYGYLVCNSFVMWVFFSPFKILGSFISTA